jgi:hypothetical protein
MAKAGIPNDACTNAVSWPAEHAWLAEQQASSSTYTNSIAVLTRNAADTVICVLQHHITGKQTWHTFDVRTMLVQFIVRTNKCTTFIY